MIEYSVILPASGIGQRFTNELPKQFVLIRNRPLLYYTVNAFLNCSIKLKNYKMNEIVISSSNEYKDFIEQNIIKPLIEQNNLLKIKLVNGGQFRHQSIFNCLQYLANFYESNETKQHIVLIHDAVRPLVEADLVAELIKNASSYGASGSICDLSSTILKVDQDNFLEFALNRNEFRASEMPQSFRFDLILASYKAANKNDIEFGTECLDLVKKYTDCKIKLIKSNANSLFKVTYKKDYFSALGMIRPKMTFKNLALNDQLERKLDLIKFNLNLNSINSNDLDINSIDFEEQKIDLNKCDVLFLFSTKNLSFIDLKILKDSSNNSKFMNVFYGHLILIFLFLTENDRLELMMNFNQSFMLINQMTILFCSNNNPINNLALYDKIKLVCSNSKSMIGQFIHV